MNDGAMRWRSRLCWSRTAGGALITSARRKMKKIGKALGSIYTAADRTRSLVTAWVTVKI